MLKSLLKILYEHLEIVGILPEKFGNENSFQRPIVFNDVKGRKILCKGFSGNKKRCSVDTGTSFLFRGLFYFNEFPARKASPAFSPNVR